MKMPPLNASLLLATSALTLVLAAPASAQSAAPAAPTPQRQAAAQKPAQPSPEDTRVPAKPADASNAGAGEAVETVTVTGTRPTSKIDRDIYDPKNDPETPVSSAADALNKAPGVSVDAEGNVTLRGNSGVQVLIDGKPSAMMQGDFRASTLQSMAAGDIDSIEVMTNPSAQFGAEGSAGIINLVMRRDRRPGKTLQINTAVGNDDRYNAAINGAYNTGKVTFQSGLTVRRDGRDGEDTSFQERLNGTNSTREDRTGNRRGRNNSYGVVAGAEFNLNEKDTAGMQFQVGKNDGENESMRRTTSTGASAYTSAIQNLSENQNDTYSARFNFSHNGDLERENFKADVRLSRADSNGIQYVDEDYDYISGTPREDRRYRQFNDQSSRNIDVSWDYNRPFAGGELVVGMEFDISETAFDNRRFNIDKTSNVSTLDTRLTNMFELDQDESEAYITYQRALGDKWTVLGGLRAENTTVTINQKTTSIYRENRYTKVHPSLTVQYMLSERGKLKFSYSKRIRRPQANDLNPFIVYNDERNARSGNPNLLPEQTHSYELGYEYNQRSKGLTFQAKLFHRKSEDIFVSRSSFIDNNVLLTTRENGGEGTATGIDLNFNAKLGSKLDLNLQSVVSQNEQPRRFGSAEGAVDKANSVNGRARVTYRVTPKDTLTAMINARGKELTGQGYREPTYFTMMSYRHKFNNRYSMTFNITDPFEINKNVTITDTDTIKARSESNGGGRVFYIGLQITPFARIGGPSSDQPQDGPRMRQGGMREGGNWGGGGGNGPGGGF
ncbi:TonB-dependent receptor [Asticcacaulis sp. AND118]|uniref:TonB-dependent receptor n=1 Tax=Asticcacaulis sp. AND118 TaxID=2840468 RepID=UPI001CFFEB2F|nr:TonB-dependent receptor [Asticcacaulis sp. AND118]UDF04905.1 TonB-dependent receptor [Asticcacaulis sp. AND118]